jgi:hypothetical protein
MPSYILARRCSIRKLNRDAAVSSLQFFGRVGLTLFFLQRFKDYSKIEQEEGIHLTSVVGSDSFFSDFHFSKTDCLSVFHVVVLLTMVIIATTRLYVIIATTRLYISS